MGGLCLAVLVLEDEGTHTVQDADLPCRDRCGMPPRLDALATSLEAVERDVSIGDEIGEDPEGIRTPTNTGHHRVRQAVVSIKKLGARLPADHPLELPDHHREGM